MREVAIICLFAFCLALLPVLVASCLRCEDKSTDRSFIELELDDPVWEGVMWMTPSNRVRGIAVRMVIVEKAEREGYGYNDSTPFGDCHSWSDKSKGKYCLVDKEHLSIRGRTVLEDYYNKESYEVLP